MVSEGVLKEDDIIRRMTTDEFPPEAATVRLADVRAEKPYVTVHIRGKSRQRQLWNGHAYECAATCRVNLLGPNAKTMCSNGDLDEGLNWLDVHNVVEKVKQAMER